MALDDKLDRRKVLAAGVSLLAVVPPLAALGNQAVPPHLDPEEVAPTVFIQTAELVRTFVEEYHEKNEEKYIFPEFEHMNQ